MGTYVTHFETSTLVVFLNSIQNDAFSTGVHIVEEPSPPICTCVWTVVFRLLLVADLASTRVAGLASNRTQAFSTVVPILCELPEEERRAFPMEFFMRHCKFCLFARTFDEDIGHLRTYLTYKIVLFSIFIEFKRINNSIRKKCKYTIL